MSFEKKMGNGLPARVVSPETMIGTVLELGIVPFFANPIPGYSIEEMTSADNWFDSQDDLSFTPWDWKIDCVQSGEIAYGKFLWGGKAAFATVEWYRELMNYRRSLPKYAPDNAQQQVLDYLQLNGSIGIKETRGLLGIKKGAADALMCRLMMQCRVVTGDIIRVYRGPNLQYNGWQYSSFCRPEDLFDNNAAPFFAGFEAHGGSSLQTNHSPSESLSFLKEHIRSIAPNATDDQITKLLN
ncbi:MAG: hypothetical protein IK008_06140 [Bacteroidales bacterium]|nr:hypothetical protein [Bacteroidales bacterium]